MLDFGAVTTAIGTIIGSIITGLVTWKTLQKDVKKSDSEEDRSNDHQYNQEQRDWRAELNLENDKLRDRAERKQLTIEKLLNEIFELKLKVTEQAILIKQYESGVGRIKKELTHDPLANGKPASTETPTDRGTVGK